MRARTSTAAAGVMLAVCLLWATAGAATGPDEPQPPCTLEPGEPKSVAKVIDGETIQLADGAEVRLVGALSPRAFDAGVAGADWPAEREAHAALTTLVAGQAVALAHSGRHADRHGRLLAHVFVDRDGARAWVQADMIAAGHARAYGMPESVACLPDLRDYETAARDGQLGLWRNPVYAIRPAPATRDLMHLRNTYQIVEGTIAAVADVRGHVYLNFGTDWREDFTAGIATARQDRAWLDEVRGLTGRRVRVRGWIERQNGPFIAVFDRAQIELIEPASAVAAASSEAPPRRRRSRARPPLEVAPAEPPPADPAPPSTD